MSDDALLEMLKRTEKAALKNSCNQRGGNFYIILMELACNPEIPLKEIVQRGFAKPPIWEFPVMVVVYFYKRLKGERPKIKPWWYWTRK